MSRYTHIKLGKPHIVTEGVIVAFTDWPARAEREAVDALDRTLRVIAKDRAHWLQRHILGPCQNDPLGQLRYWTARWTTTSAPASTTASRPSSSSPPSQP